VVSLWAGTLYERLGAKPIVSAGALSICLGLLLVSLVGTGSAYAALVPGLVAMGIGVGLYYSTITTAGVTALDASRSSLAGAVVYMVQIAGGSIGLGLTTAIFTGVSQATLRRDASELGIAANAEDLDAVHGILAGTDSAQQVLASYPQTVAHQLVSLAEDAFVTGMQWALRVDVALAFAGFLVALFCVGGSIRALRLPREVSAHIE
jgi:hypothetical protein